MAEKEKYTGKDYLADIVRGLGAGFSGKDVVRKYEAIPAGLPEAAGVSRDIFNVLLQERKQAAGIAERGEQARKTAEARLDRITAQDPLLDDYSKTLGIEKSNLIGKPSGPIISVYGRIKSRQERMTYSEPQPIYNESGDEIGYYQKSSTGKLITTPMSSAVTGSQKSKDLNAVNEIMTDMFNTAKGFEPESGPMQRLKGFENFVKAKVGAAPDKKAYIDSIDSFLGNLSREYGGERGVLTDQDISRIKSALPSLYDTDEEIDYKFKQVQKVIASRTAAISAGKLTVPISKGGTSLKPAESKKVGDATWVKTDKGWVKQ